MNENKNQSKCLYQSVPAASEINKVSGFDPFRFLRIAVSEKTQEKVWRLDLRYMKAWFRMARPNGRMKLKPLRITEKIAIYEAQVYMDRSDTEPFSNFTAQCSVEDSQTGDYIKEAQEAALAVALNDAGFGIQFVDLTGRDKEERYGSEVPVSKVQQAAPQQPVSKPMPQIQQQPPMMQGTGQPVTERQTPAPQRTEPIPKSGTQSKPAPQAEPGKHVQQSQVQQPMQGQRLQTSPVQQPVQGQRPQTLPVQQSVKKQSSQMPPFQQTRQASQPQSQQPPQGQKLPLQSQQQPVEQQMQTLLVQQAEQKIPSEPVVPQAKEPTAQRMEESLPVAPEETHLPVEQSANATKTERLPVTGSQENTVPFERPAQQQETNLPVEPSVPKPAVIQAEHSSNLMYTPDMPVEEIVKLMTYEEARNVVVDMGVCKDWTMEQVAERRPPSLRFYVYGGYKGNNNIVLAAAKIMLDSLEAQKAS